MKNENKSLKTSTFYQRFSSDCKTMLSYCWKSRKISKEKTPIFQRRKKQSQRFYQKMHCVKVKNRDLLKSKKLEEF